MRKYNFIIVLSLSALACGIYLSSTAWGSDFKLKFLPAPSNQVEQKIVRTLLKSQIEDVESVAREVETDKERQKVSIETSTFDLNGDGKKEIFAYPIHSGFCGMHGCSLHIFSFQNDKWTLIKFGKNLDFITVGEDMSISSEVVNGYHSIIFNGQNNEQLVWEWNGNEYVKKN